ncbi:hypothetical protein BJX76DRAFT_357825 [Aspergillus varians]
MPVTELACLHLKNHLSLSDSTNTALATKLRQGITAQARYTNADAYILSQIEDPSYIYILGRWASVAQHMEEWIPSETNQAIMGGMSDGVELTWIQHLDLDPSTSSAVTGGEEGIPFTASVVGIGRCFVSVAPGSKDGLNRTFSETKHHLKNFKGPREIAGGWRVDREVDEEGNEKDEFVLFSGWESVEEHFSFAESDGFKEFARIKQFIREAEIKHARWEFTA